MKKRHLWIVAIAIAASITLGFAQRTADTILHNGRVLTVDAQFSVAEAVAVRGSRILAVGTSNEVLKLAGPDTLEMDLKGRTVTPGLIHTHVHVESPDDPPWTYGDDLPASVRKKYPLNFRLVKTKDDVLKQIRDIIAAFQFKPGEWIYFISNPSVDQAEVLLEELNRWELDKAAPDNPIILTTGVPILNMLLVNSKAIDELWSKHGDFIETYGRYWIDEFGRPEGHLEPPAVRILLEEFVPQPAVEVVAPIFRKMLEERSALGVTTISGGLHTASLEAYQWLVSRGEMPMRYGYGVSWTFGQPGADMKQFEMGAGTEMLWIVAMSARAADGLGSRMCTALERDSQAAAAATGEKARLVGLSAVSEWWPRGQCHLDIEYNAGTRGAGIKANYFLEWYNQLARDGLRSGNTGMSGEESHSRFISALENIDRARPGSVKGWAMDHCDLIDPVDIPRAAKLGLMWSCRPRNILRNSLEVAAAFGEQVAHTYPLPIKSMLEAGINVSLEGEWLAMETLITRKDDKGNVWGLDQGIDRVTALRMATQNGANYVLRGDTLGSIEPGKLADLVIIDRDYMSVPEDDISEIRSLMTLLGGKIIFLRSDFADEQNLRPAGALISTYEELVARR